MARREILRASTCRARRESEGAMSDDHPVVAGETADQEFGRSGRRLANRLAGGIGILISVPVGAVAGSAALVGVAALTANRWLAGLAGAMATVLVTLAAARWGAARVSTAAWARRTRAGTAVGLSIVLVG